MNGEKKVYYLERLERAKKVIDEYLEEARCGLFFTRNSVGDYMQTVYEDDEITIDICRGYEYFEVFGLTETEEEELQKYYAKRSEELAKQRKLS